MRITERQRLILLGIDSDLANYKGRVPRYEHGNHVLVTERQRIADAHLGFVACDSGRWLGHPMTPSDHVMVSREYKRLKAAGLIERHALGSNETHTTHLSLTDAGRKAAAELKAQEAATDG